MARSEPATLIALKGGPAVSLETLQLLWELENRGFSVVRLGDRLQVHPPSALTTGDVARIRHHRDHLLALVDYCAAEVIQ
jgi:hypothetical protein